MRSAGEGKASSRTPIAWLRGIDARAKLVFLAAFMLATLHASSPASMGVCVGIALAFALLVRLDARSVRAVVLPLVPILLFTLVLQVATLQEGEAVATIGGVSITWDALAASGRMLCCLFALVLASVSFMRCTAVEDLVFVLRWLLSPLRRMGVRTDAFVLSLTVAMGFAPVLVGEFNRLRMAQQARLADFDGTLRARIRAYSRLFAPLLHSSFQHADALAESFLSRGFSCHPMPTSLHPGRFGAPEAACLILAAVLVVLVVLLG